MRHFPKQKGILVQDCSVESAALWRHLQRRGERTNDNIFLLAMYIFITFLKKLFAQEAHLFDRDKRAQRRYMNNQLFLQISKSSKLVELSSSSSTSSPFSSSSSSSYLFHNPHLLAPPHIHLGAPPLHPHHPPPRDVRVVGQNRSHLSWLDHSIFWGELY